jgi:putative membrane protein
VTLGLGAAAALYTTGAARLWSEAGAGHGVLPRHALAYAAGIATLAVALLSPLDAASDVLFSAHMAQHELLMLVAAPLVVLGRPLVPLVWALPRRWRRGAMRALRSAPAARLGRVATAPLVALILHGLVRWLWHLPAAYDAALADERIHVVQHLTFFGTAVLFWWSLVRGRYGAAGYGVGVAFVFLTMLHSGLLAALISMAGDPWYTVHRDRSLAWGIDPLRDQQRAGLLMWIPVGVLMTATALALLAAWIGAAGRRARGSAHRGLAGLIVLALAAGCDDRYPDARGRQLTGGEPARGRDAIQHYGCGSCHDIPGVPGAAGRVGPPLGGVASRLYLAGRLPNTPENLIRWITHPQAIEPGNVMPEMGVTDQDARDIAAHLLTLR